MQPPWLTVPLSIIIRNDNHILDLNDMRGIAADLIVVAYSKIDGFPQITEKNLGVGKKFYKHSEKANSF